MEDDELRRSRRAIRSVQKRLRQDALDECWSGLTLRAVHVCLLIYLLSSDAGVAAAYADEARRRRRRYLPAAVSTAPICVSQWFVDVPFATLEELMSPTSAKTRSIHREAQIYMAQHRTAVWVGNKIQILKLRLSSSKSLPDSKQNSLMDLATKVCFRLLVAVTGSMARPGDCAGSGATVLQRNFL